MLEINGVQLLNAYEVSERLGIHRATLRRWVDIGRFPSGRHYAGHWYWPAPQVRQWADEALQLKDIAARPEERS